ncbi:hypothetical protein [Streptomyces albireticuli]|uniref:Uncharacterized protein n=1 Tax=Streptomyces albireticuli TaxID=1940 RepID=A0A2A2DAL4_9ACTN|nr:hypothetical protein [Streptomyces albireticuli]MCD9141079.1 hypothetical protein [Streptomyces albireticuli]MCD9160960.1 hypothetical protein [Streptomyces albireticuli]MCD9190983.1 hypothetical protein [Streptomyces albireticuli]PAU48564.1 hypothetical protein CK936_12550 [Streptomyces albireticuli]
MTVDQWHASPSRQADATTDSATGEVRLPVALFQFESLQGTVDLVLTRLEAVKLYLLLARVLSGSGFVAPGRLA